MCHPLPLGEGADIIPLRECLIIAAWFALLQCWCRASLVGGIESSGKADDAMQNALYLASLTFSADDWPYRWHTYLLSTSNVDWSNSKLLPRCVKADRYSSFSQATKNVFLFPLPWKALVESQPEKVWIPISAKHTPFPRAVDTLTRSMILVLLPTPVKKNKLHGRSLCRLKAITATSVSGLLMTSVSCSCAAWCACKNTLVSHYSWSHSRSLTAITVCEPSDTFKQWHSSPCAMYTVNSLPTTVRSASFHTSKRNSDSAALFVPSDRNLVSSGSFHKFAPVVCHQQLYVTVLHF